MKNEELYKLLREFKDGKIGINKAKDEILLLFSVSGRIEQLRAYREWFLNLSQDEHGWYEGRYEEVFLIL